MVVASQERNALLEAQNVALETELAAAQEALAAAEAENKLMAEHLAAALESAANTSEARA